MLTVDVVIAIVCAYFVGCLTTGYYLVKWRNKQDLRTLGSGSLGARNAGRVLGKWGFYAVLIGDLARGALVMLGAILLGYSAWPLTFIMLALICGHIWPLQLKAHGGKGVAISLGALAVWDFRLLVILCLLALFYYLIVLRKQLAALLALISLPVISMILLQPPAHYIMLVLMAVLIGFAHRDNIKQGWRELKIKKQATKSEV